MEFSKVKLCSRPAMIVAMQVNKDLACGTEAYSVQLVAKEAEGKSMKDIKIVTKFVNVFVDNLPRLLPI